MLKGSEKSGFTMSRHTYSLWKAMVIHNACILWQVSQEYVPSPSLSPSNSLVLSSAVEWQSSALALTIVSSQVMPYPRSNNN